MNWLALAAGILAAAPREAAQAPPFELVFEWTVSGNQDLYVVGAQGGTPRRLTTDPHVDALPRWSADGATVSRGGQRFSPHLNSRRRWKSPYSSRLVRAPNISPEIRRAGAPSTVTTVKTFFGSELSPCGAVYLPVSSLGRSTPVTLAWGMPSQVSQPDRSAPLKSEIHPTDGDGDGAAWIGIEPSVITATTTTTAARPDFTCISLIPRRAVG